LSEQRPTSGVRYALERAEVTPEQVAYAGFAHLPDVDVPLDVRIALPGGAVQASAQPAPGVTEARAEGLAKVASALVRAATKSEIAAGQALPRKIVRWRG
jgi:hypothetical protein